MQALNTNKINIWYKKQFKLKLNIQLKNTTFKSSPLDDNYCRDNFKIYYRGRNYHDIIAWIWL